MTETKTCSTNNNCYQHILRIYTIHLYNKSNVDVEINNYMHSYYLNNQIILNRTKYVYKYISV